MSRRDDERKKRGVRDPIEQMLRSKDLAERLKAVQLLGERRDKTRLLSLLFSESWHVREKTAKLLISFGEEIKDDVLPLLNEGYWYVRAVACSIIGEIGDKRALPRLLELLKENNETVRGEAAKAIAKLIRRDRRLMESVDLNDRLTLENTLKAQKAFDLLEVVKGYEEMDR
jgi:HEAT repeat protein